MIRVFIVDDHRLIIEGLRASLEKQEDIVVVGHACDGASCRQYFENQDADVVMMDINLPDANGIELCAELVKRHPSLKVIGLSTFSQRNYIDKMMNHGAKGYILKTTNVEEIREAVRQVYKGHIFISKDAGAILYQAQSEKESLPPLTPREVEILKLITDGLTAPEIAEKLFLSQLTVESHRRNIMAKLKAKNVATLIKMATENNLI